MKTLHKILIIAISGILLMASCKNYLDVPPQSQIEEEAIRRDPKAAEQLVTGVYNSMWNGGMHGFSFVGITNTASDDADVGSYPGDQADNLALLDRIAFTANIYSLNDTWIGYYQGIAKVNQALEKIPLSPADESVKNRLMGECRFLRAYFYFNLVRIFGGVPKLDRVPTVAEANSDRFQVKAPVDSIYAFIISDLEFALKNTAAKGTPDFKSGRASKAAAAGLLAKAYLYRQNWQRAFSLTDSIITQKLGPYSLAADYAGIFKQAGDNNEETVFEIQTGVNVACNAAIPTYVICQGPRAGGRGGWADLGWGLGTPSQSLVDEYEPGDKRKAGTIILIQPNGTVLWDGYRIPGRDSVQNDYYNYKAYHSRNAEAYCGSVDYIPKNLKILRYAEVMLIHAEAALAMGNSGAALQDVNALRTPRAGLAPLTTVDRHAIWHERRVELAMEHDRYFDLVRQNRVEPGRAAAVFAKHGKTFRAGINDVFPIPQQQIDLSQGRLKQNTGYN